MRINLQFYCKPISGQDREIPFALVLLEGKKTIADFNELNLTLKNWKDKDKVYFVDGFSKQEIDNFFDENLSFPKNEIIPYIGDIKFTAFSVRVSKDGLFSLINAIWEDHDSDYPPQNKYFVLNNEAFKVRLYETRESTKVQLDFNVELKKAIPLVYYKASDGYISFGEEISIYGKNNVSLLANLETTGNKLAKKITKDPDETNSKRIIDKIYLNDEEFKGGWLELNLNPNSQNILKIRPELGTDFTIIINSKESEFVTVTRQSNDNDGSYSIENYNDYKAFDSNNIAKDNSSYEVLETSPTYLMPRIIFTDQTSPSIKLKVKSEFNVIKSGIYEYTFKMSEFESLKKTFLWWEGNQYGRDITLEKGNIIDNYISINDGNGNLKGKIQVYDKGTPTSSVDVKPVIIKYKSKIGKSINLEKINNTFYQAQMNVTFDDQQTIEITESIIRTINFIEYSQQDVIDFLDDFDLNGDFEKFAYIFKKIYKYYLKGAINSNKHEILSVPFYVGNIGGYAYQTGNEIFSLVFSSENLGYTPSHELLHLFGLKDLMFELGWCSFDQIKNKSTCRPQYSVPNIMSYSTNNCGLWIWQLNIINR